MANARKDLDYYGTMAGQAGAGHAIAQSVLRTLDWGVQAGSPDAWVLELVSLLARQEPPAA